MNGTLNCVLKTLGTSYGKTTEMPIYVNKFTRDDLLILFKDLGFRRGVEIGTAKGIYALQMCTVIPGLKLFCIDPWIQHKDYNMYHQDTLESQYEVAKKKLEPYDCTIIRKFSLDAVEAFEDKSFDFVYVDGDHFFDPTYGDLRAWSKKIKSGGIIAGHDYEKYPWRNSRHWKVIEAVNAYTTDNNIRPWFVFGQNKNSFHYRDCPRSYMWVID